VSKIAIACPSATGHLNPCLTLAAALAERGHHIVFYTIVDAAERIERAGFTCRAYAEAEFPKGTIAGRYEELGELKGSRALRHTIDLVTARAAAGLRDLPKLVREDRIEGLVVDQLCAAAAVVARSEGIPYVTLSNALALNQEPAVPPFFTTWQYSDSLPARCRNVVAWNVFNHMTKPILAAINEFQRERRLPRYDRIGAAISPLAQIAQQPAQFDFPRERLSETFHYAGPLHSIATRPPVDFPFEQLSGRPLVYASMGTLQNRIRKVFRVIAEACEPLPVELVISLGGGADLSQFNDLPGKSITVGYAPQLELLQRASLCITHAGMNTALESLSEGVPMVAVPVTNDQPGVAARVHWLGVGQCVPLACANVRTLRKAISAVLGDSGYAKKSRALQRDVRSLDGPTRAAEIIETAISAGQPVERCDDLMATVTSSVFRQQVVLEDFRAEQGVPTLSRRSPEFL
jgi:MGT family glycosyltransferase